MEKQQVWLSSDFHGYHKNICKGSSSWDSNRNDNNGQSCRDFKDEFEMTDVLIDTINKYVKENDIIYFLGDFTFGGLDKIYKFRQRIECKNIHLFYGNHDHHIENNRFILDDNGDKIQIDNHGNFLRTQDLFASVQYVGEIKVNGITVFCSHYAHRCWNKSHKGRPHAYGHSHNSLEYEEWGKSLDVGIDSAFARFGEYRPFNFNEFMEIVNKRDVKIIDHHQSHTN